MKFNKRVKKNGCKKLKGIIFLPIQNKFA